MRFLNWFEEVMVWAIITVALLALLSGCAVNDEQPWKPPAPIQGECPIPVCEKTHPRDKECVRTYCMSQQDLERMTRPAGPVLR